MVSKLRAGYPERWQTYNFVLIAVLTCCTMDPIRLPSGLLSLTERHLAHVGGALEPSKRLELCARRERRSARRVLVTQTFGDASATTS